MIIDFHTHCFPEKIASRALDVLSRSSGMMFPFHSGTAQSLVSALKDGGADRGVVLSIATNTHQQRSVNDFAISLLGCKELIPFGSVHPDSEDALEELERLHEAGIKGVKFHPEYQNFFVDEDRMLPFYEKIGKLGMITVFHSGFDLGYDAPFHCTPERLARVLGAFGGAPVVAAHLGGVAELQDTLVHLCGKDVYLDTAFAYGVIAPHTAKEIIDSHSADRILFGTDLPWSSVKHGLAFLDCLDLSEDDYKKITGGNARRLLNI